VRIVLDTTILVRAHEGCRGPARQLLVDLVPSSHRLILCNEILYEVAKVLRYPRMQALHGLQETRIYDYVGFLREVAEMIEPNPLLSVPIRDVNDIVVVQTAVIGGANVICTKDEDFYDPAITEFLSRQGISVLDDLALIRRMKS
jgi:putative PIN family toxin of toxin-antitoxin system